MQIDSGFRVARHKLVEPGNQFRGSLESIDGLECHRFGAEVKVVVRGIPELLEEREAGRRVWVNLLKQFRNIRVLTPSPGGLIVQSLFTIGSSLQEGSVLRSANAGASTCFTFYIYQESANFQEFTSPH